MTKAAFRVFLAAFFFYEERTAQRAAEEEHVHYSRGDLMEFSWNAFRSSSMCACLSAGSFVKYVCRCVCVGARERALGALAQKWKLKNFMTLELPTAFHAPRTMIYDF